ncbi:hypothetical protein ISX56_28380, partial [Serratia ureilytica]|nr:hypothetical protein [Serratia ureilytica]
MWLVGFSRIELSNLQLYLASAASLLLSAYSLTLPRCPTNRAAESKSWVSVLGLDALVLFRQRRNKKDVGRATMLAVLSALAVYLMVTLLSLGVVPR